MVGPNATLRDNTDFEWDHVVKRFVSFVWIGVDKSLKELSTDKIISCDNDKSKQIN